MTHPANTLALVADIGGTNTRVALADGLDLLPGSIRRYANADYPGLEAVLQRYRADEGGVDPAAACVAVAGPVRDGAASMTNLDWRMDTETIGVATQAETVAILNDLQAQGHALGHLPAENIRTLWKGTPAASGATCLVVGVGTGFNAAPVFDGPGGRLVAPSESGHVTLPVRNAQDLKLAAFLSEAHQFAAVEEALSGRGIENLYAFMGHEAGDAKRLKAAEIMAGCNDGSDARAVAAARLFCTHLGGVLGNLALTQLPFGGIYLVGGVSRAFAPLLLDFGLKAAFRDKGRFARFMDEFAVHVVEDDYAALTGCAAYLHGTQNAI